MFLFWDRHSQGQQQVLLLILTLGLARSCHCRSYATCWFCHSREFCLLRFLKYCSPFPVRKMDGHKGRQSFSPQSCGWLQISVIDQKVVSCTLRAWCAFGFILLGPCPHQSIPVEMDERMAVSSVDLAFLPSCNQCDRHEENSREAEKNGCDRDMHGTGPGRLPEGLGQGGGRAAFQACIDRHFMPQQAVHPGHLVSGQQPYYKRDPMDDHKSLTRPSDRGYYLSFEEPESLEPPLPLMSNMNWVHQNVTGHQAPHFPG